MDVSSVIMGSSPGSPAVPGAPRVAVGVPSAKGVFDSAPKDKRPSPTGWGDATDILFPPIPIGELSVKEKGGGGMPAADSAYGLNTDAPNWLQSDMRRPRGDSLVSLDGESFELGSPMEGSSMFNIDEDVVSSSNNSMGLGSIFSLPSSPLRWSPPRKKKTGASPASSNQKAEKKKKGGGSWMPGFGSKKK